MRRPNHGGTASSPLATRTSVVRGERFDIALPARDDGGAVVAHLACNGERFFVALPLHALWAEHDARLGSGLRGVDGVARSLETEMQELNAA